MTKINSPLIVLLISVALSNCHKPRSITNSKNEFNKIIINWVEPDLETEMRIDYDQFNNDFGGGEFKTIVSSEKEINDVIFLMRNMKAIDNSYQPDVRAKMQLFHSGGVVDTVCFSDIVLRFKNKSYETPRQLIKFPVNKGGPCC